MEQFSGMEVLWWSHPYTPQQTYKRSLAVDMLLQVLCVVGSILLFLLNASSYLGMLVIIQFFSSILFFCLDGYLFFTAPNNQRILAGVTKDLAHYYSKTKLVTGWIGIIGSSIAALWLIYYVQDSEYHRKNSTGVSQVIALFTLIVMIIVSPLIVISFQLGKNLIKSVEAMSINANYFHPPGRLARE